MVAPKSDVEILRLRQGHGSKLGFLFLTEQKSPYSRYKRS